MLSSRQKEKRKRKLYWNGSSGGAGNSTGKGLMPVPDVVPGNGEAGILFRYPHLSLTEQPPLLGLPSSGSVTSSHRAGSHNGGRLCVCTSV